MRDRIKESLRDKIKDWQEKYIKRVYFSIDKKDILEVTQVLFRSLELRFITISATDMPDYFEVIYHFSNDPAGEIYSVRVTLNDKLKPEIQSITPLFPAAEWIERESWEMLGINFKGHPNLKKLLLNEDWPESDYPLRNKK
ncbi:MAG: NADH-quinone oxidoreductase subunit C [Candidatus Omnitrophica bacterium]|nr:NADH-quinone oxidoreductase subunit C [Candidatus Omnitrophota bacterium]MDD5661750.1 NADH-quinone oxidoreductase subunit C [Candidatus Omnitrophota bacterium]